MSTERHGFPCRVKWLDKTEGIRSLEVMVTVHPLHIPRRELSSLSDLCNGRDCWVHIGHTVPNKSGSGHCFIIYGKFFESRLPYLGHRDTLDEVFESMVSVLKARFNTIETAPLQMGEDV